MAISTHVWDKISFAMYSDRGSNTGAGPPLEPQFISFYFPLQCILTMVAIRGQVPPLSHNLYNFIFSCVCSTTDYILSNYYSVLSKYLLHSFKILLRSLEILLRSNDIVILFHSLEISISFPRNSNLLRSLTISLYFVPSKKKYFIPSKYYCVLSQ